MSEDRNVEARSVGGESDAGVPSGTSAPAGRIPEGFSVDAFRVNDAGVPGPASALRALEEGLAALGDGCPLLGITRQMAGLAAAVPGVISATVGDSLMGPGKVHQVLLEAAPGTDLRAVAEAMAPCRHALLVVEGRGPGRSDLRAWNYGPHKCECDWSSP